MPLYTDVFRDDVGSWPFFSEKQFFLIKLFFAILYKESISNDFKGLWCLVEVFSAKLCWFQNLFVFLQVHCGDNCTPMGVRATLQDIAGKEELYRRF